MRVVVVEPAEPVIELDEAKEHLRVDHDDDDDLIEVMLAAATGHIDGPTGWLGRAIGEQVLEAYCPAPLLIGRTLLPYRPVTDVEAVEARTDAGWAAIDPALYELRGDWLAFQSTISNAAAWKVGDAESMRVRYRAGYEEVPAPVRVAILMMTADLYKFRESVSATSSAAEVRIPTAVQMLLQPFRIYT